MENATTLTLATAGTKDRTAAATVAFEVTGDITSTIDNQVQALMAADLDLADGEYAVYDEQTRQFGADFVVRSSAGVIQSNWRHATDADACIRYA